jgi:hypothetical protein
VLIGVSAAAPFSAPTAGTIELVDSAFLAHIPQEQHDAGHEVLGVKAKYPRFSWKSQEVRPGLPRDAFDMQVTLLTPRARATRAIVATLRTEGEVNTSKSNPAYFNNGFLFAAVHELSFGRSKNLGWTRVSAVECRLKDGRVIEPIITQFDSTTVIIQGYHQKLVDLQALFPLWLLEANEELRFAIFFADKDPFIVRYSAKKVKDLR